MFITQITVWTRTVLLIPRADKKNPPNQGL